MATGNLGKHSTTVRHVLITGPPGIGKTTLVCKVLESPSLHQVPICGFLTREVRNSSSGRRVGFDVVSLQGHPHAEKRNAALARTRDSVAKALPAGPNVGNYVVDVRSFESVALTAVRPAQQENNVGPVSWPPGTLCVIDEIGKMELFSGAFRNAVEQVMKQEKTVVLATVPLVSKGKGLSLVDDLKARHNVKLFEVTRENRDSLVEQVASILKSCLSS